MNRSPEEILKSIYELGLKAKEVKEGKINLASEIVDEVMGNLSFFNQLRNALEEAQRIHGIDMTNEELESSLKKIIEPMLFQWMKENLPSITKEVIKEVIEKNKLVERTTNNLKRNS